MNDLISSVSQVGFPIVVALLLLVRIESKMEKVGEKIEKLGERVDANTSATNKLTTVIDERIRRKR